MFKRSHSSDRLHDIPLFDGCTPEELARIDSSLTAVRLDAGQVVVHEGHYGAELLIVAEGEVRVTRHSPAGEQELAVLGRGDFVGEIALLEGTPRTASVTAVTVGPGPRGQPAGVRRADVHPVGRHGHPPGRRRPDGGQSPGARGLSGAARTRYPAEDRRRPTPRGCQVLERTELMELAKRMLAHVENGTTDQTDDLMEVPVSEYADPDRWAAEMEVIFKRMPLALGLTCELREPGAYKAIDVLGVPVLISRGADGVARSFLNVCRHRGAALRMPDAAPPAASPARTTRGATTRRAGSSASTARSPTARWTATPTA